MNNPGPALSIDSVLAGEKVIPHDELPERYENVRHQEGADPPSRGMWGNYETGARVGIAW